MIAGKILRWCAKYITRDERSVLKAEAAIVEGETMFSILHNDYRWRKVRNAYVRTHPVCAACGYDKDIQVHHIQPWHINERLRYDSENLVTLCQPCHFRYGHFCNWKDWNPLIETLADQIHEGVQDGKRKLSRIRLEATERDHLAMIYGYIQT